MLKLHDIHTYYGRIHALKGVSIEVQDGTIVTLLGANGAGKTTMLRTISGIVPASAGKIEYDGKNIEKSPPQKIVQQGIAQSPEGRQVFTELTVLENLRMGTYPRKDKSEVNKDFDMIFNYFPRLKQRINQLAGTLSGGEQQMLAMGRALMSRPKILLLDEPSLGLAPLVVKEIFHIIQEINKRGVTVLLVEQNAYQALRIAHYGYVLETGRVVLQGTGDDLRRNDEIRHSYLGR
ncbi:MAG: ABC transporter ATP-binding protein [Chloroflexi bacterium]|uniref:ABC transporter ATP-binding protein n=1 Tax=Candidatus Chlorohelix allophototropha TaxID=3003348 RepID=A0A8T7M4Z6_9CHLR|nr:ABC transporter ATP-binding protein [Chloroflexota bacterium]WJW69092.1 ABC transporter ATP-binding protein [Chloroflexota bacterium L227-S17]